MTASIRATTGSLSLLHFLLGVFLSRPEGGVALELLPSSPEVLLQSQSNFSVVCSGWSEVKWRLPQDADGGPEVLVQVDGSSRILQLLGATWRSSGRYTCEEPSADQSRAVDVFVPGQGPEQWFVPQSSSQVYKHSEEGTIPCVVSDPKLNVSLFERPGRTAVGGVRYEPALGFMGRLNDAGHVCVATDGDQEKESQVFYVFTVLEPKQMEMELSVSSQVLKQGEVLTMNCSVRDVDMAFFTWTFPRRQEVEPLTDILSNEIRSFINISKATESDSGVYVCKAQDSQFRWTVRKNITITVLDRGYVYLWPSGETNISSLVHHTVELKVQCDAHPTPTFTWSRPNQTIAIETSSINTTHLTSSRYVSTLTLHQVQLDQTGTYTATASNEDSREDVMFYLQVTAPPRIVSLSEVDKKDILCVSEGVPTPSVTWYTCPRSIRCSNLSDGWRSQLGALEQDVTTVIEGGGTLVKSVLTLKTLNSVSAVRCEATNAAGGRARDLRVLRTSLLVQVVVLVAVLVLVIIGVIFFIILIALWRNKPHYEARWKLMESEGSDGQPGSYVDPGDLPYSSAWEIPRDQVALGQVLGSGPFGRVVEATVSGLTGSDAPTKAAVKIMKSRRDAAQSLVSELKVLGYLGPHLNVVNLLGACTSPGPVYLITEFCRHGNLLSYLQRNKDTFGQVDMPIRSNSDGGYMDMNQDGRGRYVPLKELKDTEQGTSHAPTDHQKAPSLLLSDSPVLTLEDLLSFSFQVAQAMDFLSSRKCVHRDLAARNVLVCEGKLLKICDFGLARDLQKDEDYIIRRNSFLPLRWMSPESIFQNIYSSESDVWSYGVLLWEIFSLGCAPYPDLLTTRQFSSALKRGHRMDRPEHATSDMYAVMKQCWDEDPLSRPSFSSLVAAVGNMLPADYRQRYAQLTEDFLRGDGPAVLQSRRSLSRTTETETETDVQLDRNSSHCAARFQEAELGFHFTGSPSSDLKERLLEAEPDDSGPSHNAYIMPVVTMATSSSTALDAVSPLLSDPAAILESQEVTSPPEAPAEEEEESCL
ncbi:platelet-derived growth factor receptor beta-like [Xiphophorus couchianus]|uniref:platelet-derived growth factor receptor beta-like n=1 Tax=Xiphophorus couchianus TaxID=32473 RepID=UPI001016EEAD|nr:platelet-derived growth factor receptor beta-like [Xiphophorus couchianus]